jgi:hypothetical protein
VYNRQYNITLTGGIFEPNLYVNSQNALVSPYGKLEIDSTLYLSGWRTTESSDEATLYDLSVVLLKTNLGRTTGTMGLRYNKNGVGGRMYAAG